MISQKLKNEMFKSMNTQILKDGKTYWDEKGIKIVTSAIIKGKELRGNGRKLIGVPISEGKIIDVYVLEGYDNGTKLAVQIPKNFRTKGFSFQAFKIGD